MAGFAGGAAVRQIILATRRLGWKGLVGRTNGGMIVHLGVVLLAVGVAASESYKTDRIFTMNPGETVQVQDHTFTYSGLAADRTTRRDRTFARIVIDNGPEYQPARTRYRQQGIVVGTPSVKPGITEDLYLVLDDVPTDPAGPIRLRVIIRPLIGWIWGGGVLMALGTLLAVFPGGKRRRGTEPVGVPAIGITTGETHPEGELVTTGESDIETPPQAGPTLGWERA
ncbi:MAG: hypothetical protein HKN03_03010 [Acidimicrobiales bacterium]|nr:hypothetical protein [Acidimicrobiales bacterium]